MFSIQNPKFLAVIFFMMEHDNFLGDEMHFQISTRKKYVFIFIILKLSI